MDQDGGVEGLGVAPVAVDVGECTGGDGECGEAWYIRMQTDDLSSHELLFPCAVRMWMGRGSDPQRIRTPIQG